MINYQDLQILKDSVKLTIDHVFSRSLAVAKAQ